MSTMTATRTVVLEPVSRCPLCDGPGLRPYGVAPADGWTLHARQSRCGACGVLVSNPRVSEADRDRYYQQRYYEQQWPDARRVVEENLALFAAHDVALVERLGRDHVKRGGRALDVGAGYGATVQTLRQRGFHATGCEMSWRGCTFAKQNGQPMVRAKSPGVPFRDGAFDLVMSAHVIEHVGDPQAFVQDLARVVAPGGLLALVTDHADASQHKWDRLRARAAFREAPFQTSTDHTFVFGTRHLRQLLEGAGCEPIAAAVYHHAAPKESWHWRAYKTTFRVVDRVMGWGPYQLALGVRKR